MIFVDWVALIQNLGKLNLQIIVKLLENPSGVFHKTGGREMGNKIIFLNISYIIFY